MTHARGFFGADRGPPLRDPCLARNAWFSAASRGSQAAQLLTNVDIPRSLAGMTDPKPNPAPDATTPGAAPKVPSDAPAAASKPAPVAPGTKVKEIGGPSGPEPTRYGDWERKGICVDF